MAQSQASDIIKATFAKAGIANDGRLGTHTLRKTWARNVYENAGHDTMVLKAALGHSDVAATQRYLEAGEDEVLAAISKCDFTRRPRRQAPLPWPNRSWLRPRTRWPRRPTTPPPAPPSLSDEPVVWLLTSGSPGPSDRIDST